jgi:hypothetical protein
MRILGRRIRIRYINMRISGSARDFRWGIEQRLEFIEFCLFWDGGINRSGLTRQFGISTPQASNDLKRYEESAPGNLVYDKSRKRYFASSNFAPRFMRPDADQYLNRLRGVANHTVTPAESWLTEVPVAESMPLPQRRVEMGVLRKVLDAIRRGRSVRVLYQSMNPSRPEPLWRWISPHAFANDGLRWHVRAFCRLDGTFQDFLLSRCLSADGDDPQDASGKLDTNWHELFNVVLVPNPRLSPSQQSIIAQDYCMTEGTISIPIRRSFLYYFQKRLRLDVKQTAHNIREMPVIVKNQMEFDSALFKAAK